MEKASVNLNSDFPFRTGLLLTCLIGFSICLFSQDYCFPHRLTDNYYFKSRDIKSVKDIVYGEAADYRGKTETLDLDIFMPDPAIDSLDKRPLIMLIHGGSHGDKSWMEKYCPLFAQRGFVVANINRRKGRSKKADKLALFQDYYRSVQDAHAALRFLVRNADSYGIDTAAIFVGGQSAGAVTAMAITFMEQEDFDLHYPDITRSLGRMDNSTNTIHTSFRIRGVADMWGQIPDTAYISSYEAHHIPVIIFHGTADSSLSPYRKSLEFAEHFDRLGACCQLHTKTGAGHGQDMSKYYIAAWTGCFFKSILCGSCSSLRREIDNTDHACNASPLLETPGNVQIANTPPLSLLEEYAGLYQESGVRKERLFIRLENEALFVSDAEGTFKNRLYPESEKDFFIREDNIQLSFLFDEDGEVSGLTVFIDAKKTVFRKK